PADLPPTGSIEEILEPWMKISVVTPSRYIGAVMELVMERRGSFERMEHLDPQRVLLSYRLPLREILVEFYDHLKPPTQRHARPQGHPSLDYHFGRYETADLVKLDLLVNAQPVDALSLITHRGNAYERGRDLVEKLRKLIPRQLFEVPIQAAIGSKVIARETIPAMRKNVLAKCYGGDITRKRKLLERQSEGKKRMKRVGSVEIPQEAFMAVLKLGDCPVLRRRRPPQVDRLGDARPERQPDLRARSGRLVGREHDLDHGQAVLAGLDRGRVV